MRGDDLREAIENDANVALSVWSNACNAYCSEEDQAHAPECLLAAGLYTSLAHLLDAHPTPSEPAEPPFFRDKATGEPCVRKGNVLCHNTDWKNHRHVAIHLDEPTPSEPEATVVEEWGVRWANGETASVSRRRDLAEVEIKRVAHNAKATGWRFYRDRHPGTLVRRTRTTYADRVTEWEEVDE